MVQRLFLASFLMTLAAPALQAATPFPDEVTVENRQLLKQGEGRFAWWGFTVYRAAYYEEITSEGPPARRLEIHYERDIPQEKIVRGGNYWLRKNVDDTTWEALQPALETLNATYTSVRKGDVYTLTTVPGLGLFLELNGSRLPLIDDPLLSQHYFAIWLGEQPLSRGLKEDLLGRG